MTIYLSSSAHHTTSKDSTFLRVPAKPADAKPPGPKQSSPRSDERHPLLDSSLSSLEDEPKEVLEPPRKVMYYAAGSGIPEIKTILSGEPRN
jgi:chloride channel 3/4/5